MKPYKSLLPAALFAAMVIGTSPVEAVNGGHGGGGGGFHGGGGGFHGGGGGFHGGGGGFHGGGAVHGGGQEHGHGDFHGGSEFHGRGEFRGDHFNRDFGRGLRFHEFGHGFRFRPRFGLGFGLFLGYPFDYPFYNGWDYWSYPIGPLAYVPGQGYGGVAFSISPGDASVTVDGTLAGTVEQFNDPQYPLNLPPGQHHIQIQAPGYKTLDVTVDVQAGQVTPYAGDLTRN